MCSRVPYSRRHRAAVACLGLRRVYYSMYQIFACKTNPVDSMFEGPDNEWATHKNPGYGVAVRLCLVDSGDPRGRVLITKRFLSCYTQISRPQIQVIVLTWGYRPVLDSNEDSQYDFIVPYTLRRCAAYSSAIRSYVARDCWDLHQRHSY